ncbi:hypothetical protein GV710_02845, partial [Klebsiella pneumoniae]|nr:hypothetical protein [Klebsiella pneumoniae]
SKKVIPLWRPQTAGPPEHFVVFGRKIPRTPISKLTPAWTLGQGMKKPVAGCYGRLTRWKGGGDVVYMALL